LEQRPLQVLPLAFEVRRLFVRSLALKSVGLVKRLALSPQIRYNAFKNTGAPGMIAYKLFKQRSDGSLGPLFINARQRVPVGEWLEAEDHPTKGFAHRPGWHCTVAQYAPHIKKKPASGQKRVWAKVEIRGRIKPFKRPELQGGTWFLATEMKVIEVIG
jgi:hypothetical protein